jgi:N-acetylated-alpha-linked acidic dipeptidase
MRRTFTAVSALAAAAVLAGPALAKDPAPTGPALEKAFDALISPPQMSDWLKRLASEPNHVGSPHDKANAEWVLAQFKAWG